MHYRNAARPPIGIAPRRRLLGTAIEWPVIFCHPNGHYRWRGRHEAQVDMPQNSRSTSACRRNAGTEESGAHLRLLPPRSAARVVARERLLAQLRDARRMRCIVVQGPAGSGKTTALVAWREALLPLGFDIAWLTFTSDDDDPTVCLDDLVGSLSQVNPSICKEAALLGGRGMDEEAVERTVIALVNGIARHPAELVLVLDDVHHLANARNHEALQWLLDYAPANLHIVFASRTIPSLSLGRLRDQGLVLELDMRDLRFTAQESEAFLKAQIGDISTKDARRLHELADGWAAGLQLFAIRAKRNRQGPNDSASADIPAQLHLHDPHAFADYFEREVLSRLSPSEVELLIRMAACARICGQLCVALVAGEQNPAEVLALFARLESDNLFVAPVESQDAAVWYRLNPLFRETLLERFGARSERYQRDVHRAAWTWFRAHGHADEAVRHALLAGEPGEAADLVLAVARELQVGGELRKLVALIRMLPVAEIQARIGLRLWMAHLHLYARDFAACETTVASLQGDIGQADPSLQYRLTLLQAALAVQRDDTDGAMSILPRLLDAPAQADGLIVGARNNILSWLYMHRGHYADARRMQLDSPPILFDDAPLVGTSAGTLNGRCFVGFSYALEGKFVQAERICRDVLFEADSRGSPAAEASCLAAALLGEVLYEFNEPDAARKLIEGRVDVLERVSVPDSVLRVHTVLASVHWLAGHHLDAMAYLERLDEYASQHGLLRLVAHGLAEQVRHHLSIDHFDAAEAALARLDTIAARVPSERASTLTAVAALTEQAHIDWCVAHEDFEAAAVRLQPLIALCEERGWQRHAVRYEMQAAVVAARLGRTAAMHKYVLSTLRRGHRLGLVRTILDADRGALDVIHAVLDATPEDPLLRFYASRLDAAHETTVAVAGRCDAPPDARANISTGAELLSEREAEVVHLLAQALPNKKIARTLGLSPETVKWHLKNIYGKLGVSSRDEAVARVRDFELGCASSEIAR
ncbi:ATP-, maltotriose- and DNA-dependent transcriptional regulator MalT [Burkholderia sp. YR290]|nr:ATP-dependent transcriptional regulator, MalT-like, LuxR family [Burkholderia sp. BT03]SKC70027.1 ATP-, maltotriose-and DNA-dependent transcriptional regulator MalT [Burkholderia sp. CF099]SKC78934.1 ATP-, maltotriose-and DNA-dependent transcriptional regulator MalT [Paraburkholderia hospita]SKC96835.1 ATP-, maltotriose-and DNA-dependent transcriptional regulator MalT [Paraburkholderia hospita]SOE56345.1 ATP-, maltotriose- and DNA-dependent transcriptional regulator MalT [Burkholderia sp. YR